MCRDVPSGAVRQRACPPPAASMSACRRLRSPAARPVVETSRPYAHSGSRAAILGCQHICLQSKALRASHAMQLSC